MPCFPSGSKKKNCRRHKSTDVLTSGSAKMLYSTSKSSHGFRRISIRRRTGKLDHWAHTPRGRLALILLLDQFRRNIHRGTADAYSEDRRALKLCVEGAMEKKDKGLSPIQRVFFYMPLQHAESRKVQEKSVAIFNRLAEAVSPTYVETFMTIAQFAELHRDIVHQFGRFPASEPGTGPTEHSRRTRVPGERRTRLRPGRLAPLLAIAAAETRDCSGASAGLRQP